MSVKKVCWQKIFIIVFVNEINTAPHIYVSHHFLNWMLSRVRRDYPIHILDSASGLWQQNTSPTSERLLHPVVLTEWWVNIHKRLLVQFPGSACQSVLGQDIELQTVISVWMLVLITVWGFGQTCLLNAINVNVHCSTEFSPQTATHSHQATHMKVGACMMLWWYLAIIHQKHKEQQQVIWGELNQMQCILGSMPIKFLIMKAHSSCGHSQMISYLSKYLKIMK